MANQSSLTIDLKQGESLALSGHAIVELVQKSGRMARLKVTAPREVTIHKIGREEVKEPQGHEMWEKV